MTQLRTVFCFFLFFLGLQSFAISQQLTISAKNNLNSGRLNETITLTAEQLKPLGKVSYNRIHVKDAAGRELICQPVRLDGGRGIIFQADFAPLQSRIFHVYTGTTQIFSAKQYRTYGRFVRERYDDFAWENDRIADRTYGLALRTANPGALTSSTIDVWAKKTSKLVINDWYMTDHYHVDNGDGADLYTSGNTRGMGGDAIWKNDKLWTPVNYSSSLVFSTGPIRVDFKLDYAPYDVAGDAVSEIRHITLDAGHNLNHFRISYPSGLPKDALAAAGIQMTNFSEEQIRKGLKPSGNKVSIERAPGRFIHEDVNTELGLVTTEQPVSEGYLYAAIITDPQQFVKTTKDKDNLLMLANVKEEDSFSYWAGFAWSNSGQFQSYEDWKNYITQFAKGLQSPILITISQ